MTDDDTTTGEIKQQVTHDLVLDIYESSLQETDPDKREAILATAKVLSENIGSYLVDMEQ